MGTTERGLELEIRRKIYNYILKNPGLHERELARQLKVSLSTLDYHLYYLKRRGIVTSRQEKHYTQYYIVGDVSVKDKEILAALRQKHLRKIVIFLLLNRDSFHREICSHLELAASTTTFHLNKLVKLGLIDRIPTGRETIFRIKELEYVSDLIIRYKKSFLDESVNRFADTWLDLHPRHLHKKKK